MASKIKAGDRVRVAAGSRMMLGAAGVVVSVSTIEHHNMNGGGYDCKVIFDNEALRRVVRSGNEQVWRELGIGAEYIALHGDEATVRDNDCYVEVA